MELNLKHLVSDTDRHGNVRFYVRMKDRPKVRIKEDPGSPEFLRAYQNAIVNGPAKSTKAQSGVSQGTLAWLGRQYMASTHFKSLDATAQRRRCAILLQCFEEPLKPGSELTFGQCPINRFGATQGRILRDRKAGKPGAARNRVKWLSTMFSWAVEEIKGVEFNPMRDVKKPSSKTDGFHTWDVDEVRQFSAHHKLGTMAHLAMSLMLFTGARRSDAVLLGRQHIRNGWLKFKPGKTRKSTQIVLDLPVLPILQRVIDASPSSDLTFLATSLGRPFASGNSFGNWFRERCDEAGLPHCTAHGLRKAGAVIAAHNGATDRQLMAIYGWASADEASVYTKQADQKRLAGAAMAFLVPD